MRALKATASRTGLAFLLLFVPLLFSLAGPALSAESPLKDLYMRIIVAGVGQAVDNQSDDGRYNGSAALKNQPQPRLNQYDQMLIYPVAYLYKNKHPLNPFTGDPRLLQSVIACGDKMLKYESEEVYPLVDWAVYSWIEAYDQVKGELGETRRQAWAQRLEYWAKIYLSYVEKSRGKRKYTAVQLGTSPNHYSLYMTTVMRAGQVLGHPEWVTLVKSEYKNVLRTQNPDGYWAEHDGPVNSYNRVSTHGVGLYYALTGDPEALECLRRATDFNLAFTYPDGSAVSVIDERNRYSNGLKADWGLLGQSHFPDGRRYNRLMVGKLAEKMGVAATGEVSRKTTGNISGLSLAWTLDNFRYSEEGPESPAPQEMKNFEARLVSGARLVRRGNWVVCLSGIITQPWEGNRYFLDRYSYLEVWHQKTGLVIGGGNTKYQPHIAGLLMEPSNSAFDFWPRESSINFNDPDLTLQVEFDTFRGRIKVTFVDDNTLKFSAGFGEKVSPTLWPNRYECNLQLQLSPGRQITTAGAEPLTLSEKPTSLLVEQVGSRLETDSWRLTVPDGTTSFRFPFIPFSNYDTDGIGGIRSAVGIVSSFTTDPGKSLDFTLTIK